MSGIDSLFENLSVNEDPAFLISTIAYVPDPESEIELEDSSDEETDEEFKENDFISPSSSRFTIKNFKKNPVFGIDLTEARQKLKHTYNKSRVVKPFLEKLTSQGFDKHGPTSDIAVSFALNRMQSVSQRKNKSLYYEMITTTYSYILHKTYGFFWECQWYDENKRKNVDYEVVRKYYKQLKRVNKDKAKEFLALESAKILVPYQHLRECAKNHRATSELVTMLRKKNNTVYFTLIDCDTIHFNGVFSGYVRIIRNCLKTNQKKNLPLVLSTGYIYPNVYPKEEYIYHIQSIADRRLRIITARTLPYCVYYPEPNTCILIRENVDTVFESFINLERKEGNMESPNLIANILEKCTIPPLFIFSDEKPLVTSIPGRAYNNKKTGKPLNSYLSPELKKGAKPNKSDFDQLKYISQSNLFKKTWYDNLFINKGIKFINTVENIVLEQHKQRCKSILLRYKNAKKKKAIQQDIINELKQFINEPHQIVESLLKFNPVTSCIHFISLIVNAITEEEVERASEGLQLYIEEETVNKIIQACADYKACVTENELEFVRSEYEEELLCIVKDLPRDYTIIFSKENVVKLLEENIVTVDELTSINLEDLKTFMYENDFVDLLANEKMFFCDVVRALVRSMCSAEEIVHNCLENVLHLKFMTGQDASEVILDNYEHIELIEFGLEYYSDEIDMAWIMRELGPWAGQELCVQLGVEIDHFDTHYLTHESTHSYCDECENSNRFV